MRTSIVVVSFYNPNVDHFRECLQSIYRQTRAADEVLIINDGSTINDYTVVIDSFPWCNLTVWNYVSNMGLAHALNDSLNYARQKGFKYYFRMDADDIMVDNRIEKQVTYLENHKTTDVLGSSAEIIDEKSRSTGRVLSKPVCDVDLKNLLFFETAFIHPSVCIRLNSGFVEYLDYRHSQDYATWVNYSKLLKYANMKDVLIKYRVGQNSITRQYSDDIYSKYDVMLKIYQELFPTWSDSEYRRHYLLTNKDRLLQSDLNLLEWIKWSQTMFRLLGVSKVIFYSILKRIYWCLKY